jgi:hypothetical protein
MTSPNTPEPIRLITQRCDIGGDYAYPDPSEPAVYQQPCSERPTHRYRALGMVEGLWLYRCSTHVTWLSAPGLVVEPLAATAPGLTGSGS